MGHARLPFSISKNENFYVALNRWVGDVLYDIFPEKGFELRDEQIFMAFQLERAFKEKKVMFAEAGVGTGKTIVYLLYAICYARYTGKPAVIACADEALIEQLVKKEGDIQKLEAALKLSIDVRLAKSNSQYLCLEKLDKALETGYDPFYEVYEALPNFVHETKGMQSFYPYGDRKQFPHLTNEEWKEINWDPFKDCFSCPKRHRCGLTLTREHYRKALDLIICSHDFYMEHVWTMDARKREGQLPLLPEHSCVVFDEGHLLEFAAQKALTYRVKRGTLQFFLERLLANDIREEFALLIEDTLALHDEFFDILHEHSEAVKGSSRRKIHRTKEVISLANQLYKHISEIGEALVFESELYTIDQYELSIVEEYLDQMEYALQLFLKNNYAIDWLEGEEDISFVIMPKKVEEILAEHIFSKKLPYIFSSATLSDQNQSFTYLATSLGMKDYLSFTVSSPFQYEEQMKITIEKMDEADRINRTHSLLRQFAGRTLILFRTEEDLKKWKEMTMKMPFHMLFEGDQEISQLIATFQRDETSVLSAVHLWEGLDIPGPSLSNVIIWSLPFPPDDPVFEAKRNSVQDPFYEVDLPYMILRLKQGVGRLIRTKDDKGTITIFVDKETDEQILKEVEKALPVRPLIT